MSADVMVHILLWSAHADKFHGNITQYHSALLLPVAPTTKVCVESVACHYYMCLQSILIVLISIECVYKFIISMMRHLQLSNIRGHDDLQEDTIMCCRLAHWKYLLFVGLAVIIRPTAAILWLPLCAWHISNYKHRVIDLCKIYACVG